MIDDDLIRRFYDEIPVDPESVQRVTGAVTGVQAPRRPGRPTIVAALAGAGVIGAIVVLLVAVHLGRGSNNAPATVGSPSSTTRVVVRTVGPNEVLGTVLRNGVAVPNATLEIVAWPNGKTLDKLHKGEAVPTRTLGTARSDASGSLLIHIPGPDVAGKYLEGDAVNVDFQLTLPDGQMGTWSSPLQVTGPQRTAAVRVSFDVGRRKVTFNGQTSTFVMQ